MRNTRGILLLATATSTAALHVLINATHIFQDVVDLKPPDKKARRDVCEEILLQINAYAGGLDYG